MREIRTALAAFILCIGVLAVSGCMSMAPVSDKGAFPADASSYTVLGCVEIESAAEKSGYSRLYQAAVKEYPECDDVVNVKVDYKETTLLFIFKFRKYSMSGIAISCK